MEIMLKNNPHHLFILGRRRSTPQSDNILTLSLCLHSYRSEVGLAQEQQGFDNEARMRAAAEKEP